MSSNSANTSSSSSSIISESFIQGFNLDVSIIQSLLKRHQCSHGKTIYYQRLQMTIKCIQKKYDIINSINRLNVLKSDTNQYTQEQKRLQRKRSAKQHSAQQEEQWTLDTTTTKQQL